MERTRFFRRPVVWIILVIAGAIALSSLFTGGPSFHRVDTSVALQQLNSGPANSIQEVTFQDKEQTLQMTLAQPQKFGDTNTNRIEAQFPAEVGDEIWNDVQNAKTADRISGDIDTQVSGDNVLLSLLVNLLPIVLLVVLLLFFMSQMQGGGSRVLNFGKSKAKMITKDTPKTTFADVAGADEAVEELREIKDFLQNPAKYQALGAKIPKGVLLFGQPGTGKTLLARAVAGEAGVPFYSISGSDFVEMFVGVGASRVRDLFEQAKANAPAIVFVDEIDAVGRHRGAGMGGGHDEREQTLNQLLVEMDGFDTKGGVILIAATNRPDILDPALLRPGRFDRQIAVDTPDMDGRKAILRVHAKGKPFAPDVDLDAVARRTPGFSGADLANVINESALLTARVDGRAITNDNLEESIDRVVAGPQRKTRVMSDHEKKITAYHEGGHALVAWALPHSAPVHKVTILPRSRSLGHTLVLPTEDKYTQTRAEMIDTLAYALGGRAAEELVFHEPTTGAGDDIKKATSLARAMVTQYGMSSKLGAVKYGTSGDEPFLGRTMGHERDYSDVVAAEIDGEVRSLIELAHDEAWEILVEYRDVLDSLVLELIEKETISTADMARIAARVVKRPPMAPFNGFGKRRPSTEPPVLTPAERDALKVQAEADGAEARVGGSSPNNNSDGAH
ncbi:ATP-dependent zinc metalloprotease FtsH [Asanoa ishikariensis]|uniref:ATP-dependent zinc metalloprotease FtsH n=1 Tax=Asanoa ishikariensis TaxID=137265 RepID=A0A1H3UX49_9ACTN|nr:ATP-dependent zinc metalloprotease FtsH [Asanoa ishikariensis]GIF65139.1 ATP-dependent zinc metalloprotease FtsH [Asanoa ishikariensis]SDZ66389.1 cell division protease FtsH [Asanoa ishikariensis]